MFNCFSAVICSAISLPNGEVSYTTSQANGGYVVDTIATFTCSSQSDLSGSSSSTCQSSGNSAVWNPQTPICDLSNENNYV